jgi:ribosome assembly protein RRB1
MPQDSSIVACWTARPSIEVHNISRILSALDELEAAARESEQDGNEQGAIEQKKMEELGKKQLVNRLAAVSNVHKVEGFAIDWSRLSRGALATGDMQGSIHISQLAQDGSMFDMDKRPLLGHQGSVEDIQWSPSQDNIFASCSTDQHIAIWDSRARKCGMVFKASPNTDVNVITWNQLHSHLIASGDDGGLLRVWDLRAIHGSKDRMSLANGAQLVRDSQPVAQFDYHKHAITSIEWHPTDPSVLVATSDDNQCTIWDLSVEPDVEHEEQHATLLASGQVTGGEIKDIPPQLLFVHQGQQYMKEAHWHPQIPGLIMTCAQDSFNIWKACNM